jgi:hypothetical protein
MDIKTFIWIFLWDNGNKPFTLIDIMTYKDRYNNLTIEYIENSLRRYLNYLHSIGLIDYIIINKSTKQYTLNLTKN